MKIGYDGKRAVCNNTGLGNYSRLAVELLATRYPENEYCLYTPKLQENARLSTLKRLPNVSLHTPGSLVGKAAPALWRISGVASQMARDGVELVHGLSGELPLNIGRIGVPSVVTMHDLIFRRCPECYHKIDREIYDYKFRTAAHAATRILAISECTKRDLITEYGVDEGKIDVVYQGCAPQFHHIPTAVEVAAVKGKYGLDRPYIIGVGTIEQRKNQGLAVKGLRGLPRDFDLVLVGRRTAYARTLDRYISTYATGNRVKFIEHADFADLPALYAGAVCSTYTSRYEGFGLPIIESLNVGTPAIVATGSCLEEAGGPKTPAVNPDDVDGWIGVANRMISSQSYHEEVARAGHAYVQQFNDDAMASGTMEVYRKAGRC